MDWNGGLGISSAGERVQYLQAQLFPVCTLTAEGFLGSFLSKSLKTNQLEVNTDERTLRPIARLKEPRDLFALPKDRDHDCPQQAARWPTECQVLDDRVCHIEYNPEQPEMYYQPTGNELRPRPVGEENGVVVFNYNPVSAVNYKNGKHRNSDGSDSESSDNSDGASTPDVSDNNKKSCKRFTEIFRYRSSSNSWDEENDEDYDDDDDYDGPKRIPTLSAVEEFVHLKQVKQIYPQRVCTTIIQKPNAPYILIDGDCILNDTKSISTSPSPSPLSSSVSVEISNNSNNNINNINNNITNNKINTTSLFENLKLTGDQNLQQFSRSSVGGSKFLMNVHTATAEDFQDLEFESRFESGNLAKAVKITSTYYELYLRPDLYTNRHKQWFYFRVSNTKRNIIYRFSIVNLVKSDSLYNEGMRPLMYSTINASSLGEGWRRCGDNISYYRNEDESSSDEDDDNGSYTLTFNIQFPNDSDTVYFAHSYPYTYTDLQDYLMEIQRHPVKSRYCKLRLLCRSLAGNNVYFLTVTAPTMDDDGNKKKKAIILSARVHPGETPSSWMMKGIMDFITGDSYAAKRLRHKFIFKLIPMLNPDGVIVGNTRSSLTGKDLNRQYRTVIRETYPSIWYTKSMIKRLIEDCGVAMYCDMHAHSRKHNVFIYGCENKRSPDKKLLEQVFPLMVHKNVADKFSFESCKFKVQRSKEGTGRVVIWMLGVTNSYTMEASFGGSTLGSRNGTHFSVAERLRNKIIERLAKEGSSAEEPLNIPLSDYSSDEGDTSSSSSDNEGKSAKYSDLEGPCCQPLKVPPCSPVLEVIQPRKDDKKIKKTKPKAKSSNVHKRSKRSQRAVLDLPTTDPGSDIQFSSDDEIYVDTEGYGTIPRTHRTFLHAEYQRKYQSDNQVEQRMPPELIVTPAKHKSSESITFKLEDKDKKVASPTITEFPPIGGSTRRTHSWHNLNNKCIPKIRINNPHDIYNIESTETLQLKLSLKKQIWTGVAPEGSAIDKNRPLSWGIPPIAKKKIQIKDENEALLTACSQKLAAWQERSDLIGGERTKGKVTINLIVPDIPLKTSTERKNSTMKLATKMELTKTSENKIKKKRNPLTKIAETTQILTRIAKSKTKSSFNHRKLSTSVLTTTSTIIPPLIGATTAATNKGHKFKTGGYVATAVQTTNKKKKSRSIISTKGNENTTESDSEKPFLKKVKSKLKKKKLKG